MAYNPNNINGQATMANSSPIVIASDQTAVSTLSGQTANSTGSWTSATSLNTAVSINVAGYSTITVGLVATSTLTAGAVTFEVSFDNTNWFSIALARINGYTVDTTYSLIASTNVAWTGSVDAFTYFRVRLSTAITGTATVGVAVAGGAAPIEPVVSIGQATASNLNAMVYAVPQTTGGLTTFHLVSAGSTNATNVKNSAGQVYGWYIYNAATAARKVAFHNTAGTPTAGSSVFFSLVIPASAGANVFNEIGISFSTGIGITTTTGVTDADTTAVTASDLVINIFYK